MTGFPVREPYGPPGRIAGRRPYHLGYQSAGFCELECIDMDADRRNDTGIFRYTDVEYTPEGIRTRTAGTISSGSRAATSNAKRIHREVIPGYLYELVKTAAAKTAGGADGGTGPHI